MNTSGLKRQERGEFKYKWSTRSLETFMCCSSKLKKVTDDTVILRSKREEEEKSLDLHFQK